MTNAEDAHSEKTNQDGLETLKKEIEKIHAELRWETRQLVFFDSIR